MGLKNKEYIYYCDELDEFLTTTLKTKGVLIGSFVDKDIFKKPFPDCFVSLFEEKEKGFRYEYIGEI